MTASPPRRGAMPFQKYRRFEPVRLADRTWPDAVLEQAPRWCSVDLRDGNQALIDPMNVEEKLSFFELLLDVGFTEIEVGFPAASQPDFDFCRRIIEQDRIPDGVAIQVLCQARAELISRTCEAMQGARDVIFHLYNSTSELQRRVVFGMERDGIRDLALEGVRLVKREIQPLLDAGTRVSLEYSPESFTGTELDFALEVCEAVMDEWGATPEAPVILNLPATVEMSTPNIYADQIEWFCRNLRQRERAVVSLHTHNDRGTGVAATELGLMAGADRVEGTLFGNGERTGNLDIVTVGMNLFSQGVDPELDLSDMPRLVRTVERLNKLPVHERHPYAGSLVFTAFSGSHQDAIRKGISKVDAERWEVPYLPIDPADVGSSYKEAVRVNSQSGKGGVGFILEEFFGVFLPREMLVEFSGYVQSLTEKHGSELTPDRIWSALEEEYVERRSPYQLIKYTLDENEGGRTSLDAVVRVGGQRVPMTGEGTGPVSAFVNALIESLNEPFNVVEFHEHSLEGGKDASAISLVTLEDAAGQRTHGIGKSQNTTTSAFHAVLSALNRRWSEDR